MKIELKNVSICELADGYVDNLEAGVIAYNGKLDVRPAYQREFVYKDKQRDAVIDSVRKSFPLNIMYWVDNGENYEVLDGQQRTISICQFVKGYYSINDQTFDNLEDDQQKQILDYILQIYVCKDGTDSEKLEWFRTINIAGEKLSNQELRNATYRGTWLTAAKIHFSKNGNPAQAIGNKYIKAQWNRQEGLEIALDWISDSKIESYMGKHQHDKNDNELWAYYQAVITWIKILFPEKYYRREMQGQDWGQLYNTYHKNDYDAETLEKEIINLIKNPEIGNKHGVYEYIFDHKEKHLNLRTFDETIKREIYEKQRGICLHCKKQFKFEEMHGDHIKAWHKGGETIRENCQMLCRECNFKKGGA